jgi:hypothetical protein
MSAIAEMEDSRSLGGLRDAITGNTAIGGRRFSCIDDGFRANNYRSFMFGFTDVAPSLPRDDDASDVDQ